MNEFTLSRPCVAQSHFDGRIDPRPRKERAYILRVPRILTPLILPWRCHLWTVRGVTPRSLAASEGLRKVWKLSDVVRHT
jgi:hypothetical protein